MSHSVTTIAPAVIPPAAPDHLIDTCSATLAALEQIHGTAVLAAALKRYDVEPGFDARRHGVDPDRMVRDINACLRFGDPESEAFADDMVARARALPVADPFPSDAATDGQSLHLLVLEQLLGTAGLEKAITAWRFDKDVQSRLNYLHQAEDDADTLASFDLMRRRGLADLADELQANWAASTPRQVAKPLPPFAVVVPQ